WSQLFAGVVLIIVGIIGGSLVLGWLSGQSHHTAQRTFDQIRARLEQSSPPLTYAADKRVTMSQYNRLSNGMSYLKVWDTLGSRGTETARIHADGVEGVMEPIETVSYSWVNSDGSNVMVVFQNDKLISKAQYGLH